MQQKDIALVLLIAVIGTMTTFTVFKAIMGDPKNLSEKVTSMRPIQNKVVEPDSEIFNKWAINPTVEIYVGECVDVDQNDILDAGEKTSCYQAEDRKIEEQKKTETVTQSNNTNVEKEALIEPVAPDPKPEVAP